MKQLLLFFLLIPFAVFSQNFEKVDAVVLNYPRFSNVENLANRIDKDFTSDIDKVRAAFFWLTKNIRYSLKILYNPKKRYYSFKYASKLEKEQKQQAIIDKLVSKAFRNKMGVCEEYAQSFKKLCDLLNIEAQVIKGYVRNHANEIGEIPNTSNHAWNAVKIDGKWMILDATWAAGYEKNRRWIRKFNNYFFNIPKDKIFKTHFPEDTIWVLRFGRISLNEFYNQPIYSNTFLKLNTELVSPKNGIIDVNTSDDIILKFKNLDTSLPIFYTLKGNKFAKKPKILSVENNTTLSVKNPKTNTELVLFINNNDALHFKIRIQ